MALVVEDGTGKSNANAYVDLIFWVDYFEARNDLTTAEKEDEDIDAAILYATRDIDQSFEWDGYRKTLAQALGWPRLGAYDKEDRLIDSSTIPTTLKEAVCERGREHLLVRKINDAVDPEAYLESLEVGPITLEWDRSLGPVPENSFYVNLLRGLYGGGSRSLPLERA